MRTRYTTFEQLKQWRLGRLGAVICHNRPNLSKCAQANPCHFVLFSIILVVLSVVCQQGWSWWSQSQPEPTIDTIISDVQKQLMTLEKALEGIVSKLNVLETEAMRQDALESLKKDFGDRETLVQATISSNTEKLDEIRRTVNEFNERIEQSKQLMEKDISAAKTSLEHQLYEQVNDIKKTIDESKDELNIMRHDVENEVKQLEKEISTASESSMRAEEARRMLQEEVGNVDKVIEVVEVLKANAFNKTVMLNLVVFLTLAVAVLTIAMWHLWNRLSSEQHHYPLGHGINVGTNTPT